MFCFYCNYDKVIDGKCVKCESIVNLTPLQNITTQMGIVKKENNIFLIRSWDAFFSIYYTAIVKYILRLGECSQKELAWAEDMASLVYEEVFKERCKYRDDQNIKFRYVLMRKAKDVVSKNQKMNKEFTIRSGEDTLQVCSENDALDAMFWRDLFIETYNYVLETNAQNKKYQEIIRYAIYYGELPNSKYLKEKFDITSDNARQIICRFSKTCREHLVKYLAFGEESKKEEKKSIHNAKWK